MTSPKRVAQKHEKNSLFQKIARFPGEMLTSLSFDRFKSKDPELSSAISAQERAQYTSLYQKSLNLTPDKIHIKKPIDVFIDSRNKSSLHPHLGHIKDDTDTLIQHFDALQKDLENVGYKIHPDDLEKELTKKKEKAVALLKEQQKADQQALSTALAARPLSEQKAALDQLEGEQTKALKTFEDSLKDNISTLQKASHAERNRVATLGSLRELNGKIRDAIDEIAQKKPRPAPSSTGTSTILGDSLPIDYSDQLKNVTLDDLLYHFNGELPTLSGNKIVMKKNSDQTYSLELSNPNIASEDFTFYAGDSEKGRADLLMASQLLKLAGQDKPTINASAGEPKKAQKLAREAYYALRAVGYPEDSITININGSKISTTDLFKDNPYDKDAAERNARLEEEMRQISHREPLDNVTHTYRNVLNQKPALPDPPPVPSSTPTGGRP